MRTRFLTLLFVATSSAAQSPDLILRKGHIFTGDAAEPWVEAISIKGDKNPCARRRRRDYGHRRQAYPGHRSWRTHGNTRYQRRARPCRRGSLWRRSSHKHPPQHHPSIEELADAVRTAAASAPPGVWIHALIGSPAITSPWLTRPAIHEAGGDHPVILQSYVGHGAILNTLGLAKVGISDDSTEDPPGGHYDRDVDGHLTGLLEEYAAGAIWRRLSDQAGIPAAIGEFRIYAQGRLEQGVTTVQVMATNQRLENLAKTFVQADEPIRLRIMRFPIPAEDSLSGDHTGSGEQIFTPLIRVAGIKRVMDGTPGDGQLAFQTKDYPCRPGWRGRPNFSVDFIDAQLKNALNGKDQLMMHIVGDAMTDEVMDEMEKLAPAEKWRPLRVRFEHGDGLTTPERMARAKSLGIVIAQPPQAASSHAPEPLEPKH
jgi:predicted amidohydrolase YtcJ